MELIWNQYGFKKTDLQTDKSTSEKNEIAENGEENKKLYCNCCNNHITDLNAAISINGEHTHTFSNPAGYSYTINCFQTAPGCLTTGDSTNEHTWFDAYEWQIVVCQSCKEQLGWLFSNDHHFYALIADRLRLE